MWARWSRTQLTVQSAGTAGQAGYHASEFVFDGLGRMITALVKTHDGESLSTDSLVARLYDLAGRITAEYQAIGSGATRHVDYAYNAGGQMTRINYPDTWRYYTYTYQQNGEIEYIRCWWLEPGYYSYVGRRLTWRSRYSTVRDDYEYDGLARLTRVTCKPYAGATCDDYAYGLDKADSRTYRENLATSGMDELYAYDTLDRLTRSERGDLNEGYDAIDDLTRYQGYELDQVGNWERFYDDSATAETRFHNAVNEITKIDDSDEYVGHDAAGNTCPPSAGRRVTRAPFGETYHSYEYDHLNRLTRVADSAGTVAEYYYDALGRRVCKLDRSGEEPVAYAYYYGQGPSDGSSWQLLNTYKNGTLYAQYLWGARYIDELVWRLRDTTGDGNLDETLFPVQDGNWNVTALVNYSTSAVVERYAYDPYGRVTVLDADWSADADGASDHDWPILYGGYYYDSETRLYHVRHRYLHAALGRWMQRDPAAYVDGMNLYGYVRSAPLANLDPTGQMDPALKQALEELQRLQILLETAWRETRNPQLIGELQQMVRAQTVRVQSLLQCSGSAGYITIALLVFAAKAVLVTGIIVGVVVLAYEVAAISYYLWKAHTVGSQLDPEQA